MAKDHVDPGKVIAHSAATQISQWTYICSAMNGSNNPFALRNARAMRADPGPGNALPANNVATLIKL